MNIYNFNEITRVFFCGGVCDDEESLLKKLQDGMSNGIEIAVHPKEVERQERLNKRRLKRGLLSSSAPNTYMTRGNGKFDESVTFVSGGFGFGTKDDKFFKELLSRINSLCEKNHSYVVFVRGANDDPSYFTEDKFNFEHIKLVKDYSVVRMKGFDCLCVGGSIPIDRQWRIEQGKRLGKSLYFENCKTEFDKDTLDSILTEYKIACIITSDAPTFISPSVDNSNASKWVNNDNTIISEITTQRMVMDSIYSETVKLAKKPYLWCYYSKIDNGENVNNIRYISSSTPYMFYDLQSTCNDVFGFLLNGEKTAAKGKKVYIKKPTNTYSTFNGRDDVLIHNDPAPGWAAMPRWMPNDGRLAEAQEENPEFDGGEALGDTAIPEHAVTTEQLQEALRELRNSINVPTDEIRPRNLGEVGDGLYFNPGYADAPQLYYGNPVLENNVAQVAITNTAEATTNRTVEE